MASLRLLSLMTVWLICAGLSLCAEEEGVDAREGDAVTLACRPAAQPASAPPLAYYWVRSNAAQQHDNVAVGAVPLQTDYKVNYAPTEGRYDLLITNATFERDNGRFECRVKAPGSGRKVHAQAYALTVLRAPRAPRVEPGPRGDAREGSPAALACRTAGGSPEPSVKWYRDGSPYPLESNVSMSRDGGDTVATLTLMPTREDDGARFRCVVWNRALPPDDQLEASVELSVSYFPRVSVGPANPLRVEEGAGVALECAVDAKPPATSVRWLRAGGPGGPGGAEGRALRLAAAARADAGAYECVADNGLGTVGRAELRLDVLYPPAVSLPANTHEVEEGAAVRLVCDVSANPPPAAVGWLREGRPAWRLAGPELRLERAAPADAGTYTCRATNVLDAAGRRAEREGSASVALLVRHRPGRAVVTPEHAVAAEGAAVTLSCAADPPGWPAPQYRWFRSAPTAGPALAAGASYTVGSAHLGSEGRYYCQATNELGHGAAGAGSLEVRQPPRWRGKPPAVLVRRAGERGWGAACGAAGKPPPRVTWRQGGAPPPAERWAPLDAQDAADGAVTSTLRPRDDRPLEPADAGLYTCVVENDVKRIETTMQLKIEHEPIIVEQRPKVAADAGETVEMECRALAYPKPEVTWSRAGAALPADRHDVQLSGDDAGRHRALLRLRHVRPQDYGDYRCDVTNALGAARATVTLLAKGPPDVPRSLRAAGVSDSSVSLQWEDEFDGGVPGLKHFVSYRRAAADAAGPAGAAPAAACGHGAADWREVECRAVPCNVTGLDQYTDYLFKVKAVNTLGQSGTSAAVGARTGVLAVPAPEQTTYWPARGSLSYHVPPACLPLRLDAQVWAGAWRPAELAEVAGAERVLAEGAHEVVLGAAERARARLCVRGAGVCSEWALATEGPLYIADGWALGSARAAALGVSLCAFLLLGVLGALYCRRRRRAGKQPGKDYELQPAPPAAAPPPYYSSGMENAALEHSLDLALAMDDCKPPYRPYHYTQDWSGPGYAEAGYGRAGSTHSHDSLWQLKGAASPAYYGPHYAEYVPPGPPPAAPPAPAHYCDPYAQVHKPKKRNDQMCESPYHEVSGLPPGEACAEPPALSLSYDESLESGYSTPNSRARRVIREIIV